MVEWPANPNHALHLVMQEVGSYSEPLVEFKRIWVAGCGTNQAAFVAKRFPNSQVVATDISTGALERAEELTRTLETKNVTLRHEAILQMHDEEGFDYIVSTGVVHHNPDSTALLRSFADHLRPQGLIEIMVYNEHHRRSQQAIQRAVSLLDRTDALRDRSVASLVSDLSQSPVLQGAMREAKGLPVEIFADQWLNPYESPFTVHRLSQEASDASLRLLCPSRSLFDAIDPTRSWFLVPEAPSTIAALLDLSDVDRWQLAQDLGLEMSPMIWFYLCHQGASTWPTSESQRVRNLQAAVFVENDERIVRWRPARDGASAVERTVVPKNQRISAASHELLQKSSRGARSFRLALDPALSEFELSQLRWELTSGPRPPLLSWRSGASSKGE